MNTKQYIDQSSAWLPDDMGGGIAISSRVRLARNLKDQSFPSWAGDDACLNIWQQLSAVLPECEVLADAQVVSMEDISALDKQVLFERHLISREQAERKSGAGVIIRSDESVAVMINEEDHIRLQSLRPGLALKKAWETADALDSQMAEILDFAFSAQLGHLTACPSNVGTGMRGSVMLHTPGLVLMDEMNVVIKGMAKIGLAVRGLWGEGSESAGNMFQVSNQITLGEREEDIIQTLDQIVLEIIEHEQNARWRVFEQNEQRVHDQVGRAYGVLSNAHILNSKEALDLLSYLRLGVDMGIVTLKDESFINELLIATQPGHLQKMQGKRLKAHERDVARAALVRSKLQKSPKRSNRKKS